MKLQKEIASHALQSSRRLALTFALLAVLIISAPLSAYTFINRTSHDVILYPASQPNRVIALQPNQCLKGNWTEYYMVMYFIRKGERNDGKPRGCLNIAGGKIQCWRHVSMIRKRNSGIWLNGDKIETGEIAEFSDDQCVKLRKR